MLDSSIYFAIMVVALNIIFYIILGGGVNKKILIANYTVFSVFVISILVYTKCSLLDYEDSRVLWNRLKELIIFTLCFIILSVYLINKRNIGSTDKKRINGLLSIFYQFNIFFISILFLVLLVSTILEDKRLSQNVILKNDFNLKDYINQTKFRYSSSYLYYPGIIPPETNKQLHKKIKNGDINAIDIVVRNAVDNNTFYYNNEYFNKEELEYVLISLNKLKSNINEEDYNKNYLLYENIIKEKIEK